ncbi:MAG: polysaccharide biosynthesis/export family protein [Flavobacteriaceae bacterium]|nr:polysaccharide biosynthesis/export family protein [Flavobacteriaceae bacterium]
MKKLLTILVLVVLSTSCIPNRDLVYFQGEKLENQSLKKLQNAPYKLQVNDMIDIQIKSADEKLVALFKTTASNNVNPNIQYTAESLYFTAYSIDRHGNIRLPYIGEINVLGYTTTEVREKIEKKFEIFFKNPDDVFIIVKLAGIRFTVLGEVKSTGAKVLYLNQVNLIEALATAGDITITGNRERVSIFRKNIDGTKRFDINMLDINSFDSDHFYIQSNDIIYIEPLKQKSWGTGTSGMQTITSLIAVLSLVTTTILLINAL